MATRELKEFAVVVDEHHDPPLRHTIGSLMASAEAADFAIGHLRIAGLDLTASEAGRLERCRVMIGHVDAAVLFDDAGKGRDRIQLLRAFAASSRLEMRTAPHHAWNPDFSVFSGLPGGRSVALLGAHYFGRPYPRFGLAFTCVMAQKTAVRACATRFEQLWSAGYDILPVVLDTLDRL